MRHWIMAVLMLAGACGCISMPEYMPVRTYVVEPEVAVTAATPTDKALAVRPLDAARPYRQAIVYRDAGQVLGYFDSAQWSELPEQVVTRTLLDALARTGRFRDVGYHTDLRAPDYILTGELRRFDLIKTSEPWTAYVEVRLELRGVLSPEVLWAQTLTATEPLGANDVAALPPAISKAVSNVIGKAVEEIAGAV